MTNAKTTPVLLARLPNNRKGRAALKTFREGANREGYRLRVLFSGPRKPGAYGTVKENAKVFRIYMDRIPSEYERKLAQDRRDNASIMWEQKRAAERALEDGRARWLAERNDLVKMLEEKERFIEAGDKEHALWVKILEDEVAKRNADSKEYVDTLAMTIRWWQVREDDVKRLQAEASMVPGWVWAVCRWLRGVELTFRRWEGGAV
jgi:hypothetical protein